MKAQYTYVQKASAIFLMAALLFLTISSPLIISTQQEYAKQMKMQFAQDASPDGGDDTADGSGNGLEEKLPNTNNLSEEFLHEYHCNHVYITIVSLYHKMKNADDYIAFHRELLVPPPNCLA